MGYIWRSGHGFGQIFANFGVLGMDLGLFGPGSGHGFGPILGLFWEIWAWIVVIFGVLGLFRPISGIIGMDLGHIRPISVIRELAGLFWGLGLNLRLLYAYFG